MKYTKDNIIGLTVRYKGCKPGDPYGEYLINTKGVWFNNSRDKTDKSTHCDYTLNQMVENINSGSWIPITLYYEIY